LLSVPLFSERRRRSASDERGAFSFSKEHLTAEMTWGETTATQAKGNGQAK